VKKSRSLRILLIVALCVALPGVLFAAEPAAKRVVVVTGKGAGADDAARDEALRDAKRRAVEQVAVKIYSETQTENYVTVLDRVLSRAQGYVTDAKILEEKVEDGTMVLKVKVTVATQTIMDDWGAIQAALEGAGKPRIMVVTEDMIDGVYSPQHSTEYALMGALGKKGFPLVEYEQLNQVSMKEMKAAHDAGDAGRMSKIASQYKGEIVLAGDAKATYGGTVTIAGVTVHQYQATVMLKAIRTDNAEVLTSFDAVGKASEMNRGSAAEKALKEASQIAATKFVKEIMVRWRDESFGGSALTVEITDVNFTGLEKIISALRTYKEVASVVQRIFRGGTAELEVTTTMPPQRLAQTLESLKGIKLNVKEMTARRIVAAFGGLEGTESQPAPIK